MRVARRFGRAMWMLFAGLAALPIGTSAAQAASLTTTFAGGNGQDGNMFDVVTAGNPLTVNSLSVNLDAGNHTIEVYTRSGSWQASPSSPVGWTLVASIAVTSAGEGLPTLVDVPDFVLPANSTIGFYVTANGGTPINYTNGSGVGNIAAQNADLQILEGAGKTYPFGGSFTPRVWNGIITYNEGTATAGGKVDTRAKTVQTIQRFLHRRNDLLLSSTPDLQRQIQRLQGGSGSQGSGAGFSGGRPPKADVVAGAASGGRAPLSGSGLSALGGPLANASTAPGVGLSGDGSSGSRDASLMAGERSSLLPVAFQSGSDRPNGYTFTTSLVDMAQRAAEAKRRQLAGGDANLAALGIDGSSLIQARTFAFDVWVQGQYASFDQGASGSESGGDFTVVYLGMDYVLSPSLLVGAVFQYDRMRDISSDLGTKTTGDGWLAGPYVTVRATDNIYLQARAAWGGSENDISPFLTYTDTFDTDRWLLEGTIEGRWEHGPWSFMPKAKIAYIEESQETYKDSAGFVIPGQTVSLGQARFGPRVGYTIMASDGTQLVPFAGLEGIWNFDESGTSLVAGTLASNEDFRGKAEVGVRATTSGGLGVDVSGSYDGLGADDYEAYAGELRVNMPLQ